jgi:hypothetical protein
MKVKVLSVKQPWAYLIFHGKDIENRTWKTNYRGELYIHASNTFDYYALQWLVDKLEFVLFGEVLKHFGISPESKFKYTKGNIGGIIGKVNLSDITNDSSSIWAMDNCYHWHISNQTEVPFIKCNGKLNIWEYEL